MTVSRKRNAVLLELLKFVKDNDFRKIYINFSV
jgi:hypothetical protein